jgi:hypothetical protein
MTKLLAVMLLMAPVSASAQNDPNTRGMMLPYPIRYEFVFQAAQQVCPRMTTISDQEMTEFLAGVKYRIGLNDEETSTLLNHCILYIQGVNDSSGN